MRGEGGGGALRQRRYLWEQFLDVGPVGVTLVERKMFTSRRTERHVAYYDMAIAVVRANSRRRTGWMAALLLTAAFALVCLFNGAWGGAAAYATMSLAVAAGWRAAHPQWIGYSPLLIWDLGTQSERILDEVNRCRWRRVVDDAARRDVGEARTMLGALERDGVLSTQDGAALRRYLSERHPAPGGYL